LQGARALLASEFATLFSDALLSLADPKTRRTEGEIFSMDYESREKKCCTL